MEKAGDGEPPVEGLSRNTSKSIARPPPPPAPLAPPTLPVLGNMAVLPPPLLGKRERASASARSSQSGSPDCSGSGSGSGSG